jgi:hypothetical protein
MQFNDRSQKLKYLYACEVARRLIERPLLVESGRRYLESKVAHNPRMRRYYLLWNDLLKHPPREIAERLTADTPEGEKLRDSMPVFEVIEGKVREQIIRESKSIPGNAPQP